MTRDLKSLTLIVGALLMVFVLNGCQFQPLYGSSGNTVGPSNVALSGLYVDEVDTRAAQQVRNHLIFLLNGGASPVNPTHDVKLRVTSITSTLAGAVVSEATNQLGNTAGNVRVRVSYEVYDHATNMLVSRGSREAGASYDKTSQNFASSRAQRDAENRAAKEVAEQLRLAIAADFSRV